MQSNEISRNNFKSLRLLEELERSSDRFKKRGIYYILFMK